METDKILHETADNIVNKFLKMLEFRPFKSVMVRQNINW